MRHKSNRSQRGATLIVGIVLLVVITMIVISNFTLSSTNLKSIGNMQFRNEAVSAANIAMEQVITSTFFTSPTAQAINVDINKDDITDYVVEVATPVCIKAEQAAVGSPSGIEVGDMGGASDEYNTLWDIEATVSDPTSGASLRMHTGVRAKRAGTLAAVCP